MNPVIVVQVLWLVYLEIGIHLGGREFKLDDDDPGFLQTSGFSTGFANGHNKYPSAVSNASVGLATIWIGM